MRDEMRPTVSALCERTHVLVDMNATTSGASTCTSVVSGHVSMIVTTKMSILIQYRRDTLVCA